MKKKNFSFLRTRLVKKYNNKATLISPKIAVTSRKAKKPTPLRISKKAVKRFIVLLHQSAKEEE